MIKLLFLLIFSLGITSLQQSVQGNNTLLRKHRSLFPTTSCTDRCHVNYLAYHTVYQKNTFKHKTHSPDKGLECHQCHNNDPVNKSTHGNLVIQNEDCWICHHKRSGKKSIDPLSSQETGNLFTAIITLNPPLEKGDKNSPDNEDCLKCHVVVEQYINGSIQNIGTKIPDWMSNLVSCTDCHRLESNENSFKSVRTYCIECHNPDYGLLYDAWKEVIDGKTQHFYQNNLHTSSIQYRLRLVQSYGMHNFRLSQMILKSIELLANKEKRLDRD